MQNSANFPSICPTNKQFHPDDLNLHFNEISQDPISSWLSARIMVFGQALLRPFCLVTNETQRHQEIPALRDQLEKENSTKDSYQKCLYVYDKAVTDYILWNQQVRYGNFMISVLKENSVATFVEPILFDTKHKINAGVESYGLYENNGIQFSIIHYRDPETGKLHRFVTTLPQSIAYF